VTVPPAWKKAVIVAVSVTPDPTVMVVADRVVMTVGFVFVTVSVNAVDVEDA
jgi:hypothetical protein